MVWQALDERIAIGPQQRRKVFRLQTRPTQPGRTASALPK
jgi:hypothetical protein